MFGTSKLAKKKIPSYLKSRKVYSNSKVKNLPKNTEWLPKTKKIFALGTFEKAIDWCVKNKRPLLIICDGNSGEGKTSVIIEYLKLFLSKYKGVNLITKNFEKYFLMGRHISLDPRIITRYYEKHDFVVIDEAHVMMNRYRSMSDQNLKANDFANTIREYQLGLILVTPSMNQLDANYVNYSNVFRLAVKYNDFQNKRVYFDVQVNCSGMEGSSRVQEYIVLENDRSVSWCDVELWKLSKRMKEGMIYGDDAKAYMTYKDNQKSHISDLEETLSNQEIVGIFKKYKIKSKDDEKLIHRVVCELLERKYKYTKIENMINSYYGKRIVNYNKIKTIEADFDLGKRI